MPGHHDAPPRDEGPTVNVDIRYVPSGAECGEVSKERATKLWSSTRHGPPSASPRCGYPMVRRPMRVVAYTRISEDPEGLALGVRRQEEDCRALAQRRGWEVAGVRQGNDVSAFNTKVMRPEFEALQGPTRASSMGWSYTTLIGLCVNRRTSNGQSASSRCGPIWSSRRCSRTLTSQVPMASPWPE